MTNADDALHSFYDSLHIETSHGVRSCARQRGIYHEAIAGTLLGIVVLCILSTSASESPNGLVPPLMIDEEQYAAMIGDMPRRGGEHTLKETRTWVV